MRQRLTFFLTSLVLFAWASNHPDFGQPSVELEAHNYDDDTEDHSFVAGGSKRGSSKRLTEYLLARHNVNAPPDGLLDVSYEMELVHILGIDELKQTMTALVYVDERWTDSSLSWDPEEFGNITKTWLPLDKIWVPDIIVFNMLDHEDLLTAVRAPGLIYANGTVETSKPFVSTVSCEINIRHFPLDDQRCALEIASWSYGKEKIRLHAHTEHSLQHYTDNEEWLLLGVKIAEQEYEHEGINVSEIRYDVSVKRKPLFYMVTLTFPSYIMCAISIVGLFARFSTTGEREERFTLGVTAILTMAVLSLVVSEKVPHSSTSVPLLVAYFLFNMIIVSFAAMTTGFVMMIHRRGRHGKEPPAWLSYMFLLKPNKYTKLRKTCDSPLHAIVVKDEKSNGHIDTTQQKIKLVEAFIRKLIDACEHMKGQMEDLDVPEHIPHNIREMREHNGWVRISERLDIMLMTIFLVIVTVPVCMLFYWTNNVYRD